MEITIIIAHTDEEASEVDRPEVFKLWSKLGPEIPFSINEEMDIFQFYISEAIKEFMQNELDLKGNFKVTNFKVAPGAMTEV